MPRCYRRSISLLSRSFADYPRTRANSKRHMQRALARKDVPDLRLCFVGGDGFEPPTPAL
jgi:hypothetical protein